MDQLSVLPGFGREIRGGQDVVAFCRLLAVMRRWRPEIVHTHTAKAGMLGRLAVWRAIRIVS